MLLKVKVKFSLVSSVETGMLIIRQGLTGPYAVEPTAVQYSS
jgi:hypothetical protein